MEKVELKLNNKARGYFLLTVDDEQLGQMEVSIIDNRLTVFHTEVNSKADGKGFAKKLLRAMTSYARKNNLKVKAICPFVHAQFKRHPEQYSDIIEK